LRAERLNKGHKSNMTKRGGARPNAGRKSKTRELLIERSRLSVVNADITPLEYLLELLSDKTNDRDTRYKAAVAAAPYVHPRLNAIEHSGNIASKTTHELTDDELVSLVLASGSGATDETEGPQISH
jgi:hypothetical protein